MEEYMQLWNIKLARWLNIDIVIDILSRLSARDLMRLKCTCSSWNNLLSHPKFQLILHKHSQNRVAGLIVHFYFHHYRYFRQHLFYPLDNKFSACGGIYENKFLMKSVIMSTSNGIICCRNPSPDKDEFKIFIGSPEHHKYILIKGAEFLDGATFAFAFFPFGRSQRDKSPSFKVANIHRIGPQGYNENLYYFSIYSSDTGKWKHSSEVCQCSYQLRKCEPLFVKGRFHWLTSGDYIITFAIEEERCALIKLPDEAECRFGKCLGESEGCLHYVNVSNWEARVWLLQENSEPMWVLKYHLNLYRIAKQAFLRHYMLSEWEKFCEDLEHVPGVVCFSNDTLGIIFARRSALVSYNLGTGRCEFTEVGLPLCDFPFLPGLLPYSFSLVARKAFLELIEMPNSPLVIVSEDNSTEIGPP